jgi:hypothetical protein
MHFFFYYFVDNSVTLLDCGVIGSEAKLVHGDDVINKYCGVLGW